MKVILKIQKDGVNTLKEEMLSHSNSKLKKIYVISSDVKESGYDIIEECLIDLKARKFIAFGIDKKNTTRKILDNVLKYTKNVYIWDNNSEIEFKSNIYVFEYEEEAFVYLFSGSITDTLLETDVTTYTKITYDLVKDKKEYEEYVDCFVKEIKSSFEKLTKEYIDELSENKLIFSTKQYIHNIPSIAELLGKTEKENVDTEVFDEEKVLPKVDLTNEDLGAFEIDLGGLDIDMSEVKTEVIPEENESEIYEEVETEAFGLEEVNNYEEEQEDYVISDEVIDMEALVLENEVVKINKKSISKSKKEDSKEVKKQVPSKKINLTKVSNIIMELGAKPTKGKDVDKIKIPNYIKEMIPQFFEIMEDAKLIKTDEGEFKEIKVNLEIIDVNTSLRYVDHDAHLRQKVGQTYIEFESEKLTDIAYEELDIARVIKLAKDSYHIEIIPKGIEEYSLWDKLCTNSFRGSNRQYGLM